MSALFRKAGEPSKTPIDLQNAPIVKYAQEVETARDVLKFDQGLIRTYRSILTLAI